MQTFDDVLSFSRHAHRNQRDKGGLPYFHHVERVVARVNDLIRGLPAGLLSREDEVVALMVAALHDTAEDEDETGVSHSDLAARGLPQAVLWRVRRLDKRFKVGSSYQENIEAMAAEGDLIVVLVKLADNEDNNSPDRIAQLRPEERSMSRRYDRANVTLRRAYEAARSAGVRGPVPA